MIQLEPSLCEKSLTVTVAQSNTAPFWRKVETHTAIELNTNDARVETKTEKKQRCESLSIEADDRGSCTEVKSWVSQQVSDMTHDSWLMMSQLVHAQHGSEQSRLIYVPYIKQGDIY